MIEPSREQLRDLLELQKIDSAIDLLENRRKALPEQMELERLTGLLEDIERQLGQLQGQVDEVGSRQSKLDDEIERIATKIAGEDQKLYSGNITTPKELSAIQAEVESLKRRRSALEDEDLEVMQERENIEKQMVPLSEQAEVLRSQIETARTKVDVAMGELKVDLDRETEQRLQWAPKIEPDLLAYYEELRPKRGGVAAAALVSGMCEGCHMKLPAQEVQRVRASAGLVHCDECQRILVVL